MSYIICVDQQDFDNLEGSIFQAVQHRLADGTTRWSNPIVHPTDGRLAIEVPDDAVGVIDEDRLVDLTSDWFARPTSGLDAERKTQAQQWAINYIESKGFSAWHAMDLLDRIQEAAAAGQTPSTKLTALRAWMKSVQGEAVVNWEAPDFAQFAEPPHTYEGAIS